MNLYINTSGKLCEVALLDNETVISHIVHNEPMQHSTVLHSLIEDLLNTIDANFSDVKAVSVLNGPGSYTGLRIGLAAAKAFCYSLDIPLILFDKLELYCSYIHDKKNTPKVACLEPARTGEYYFCILENQESIQASSVYEIAIIKSTLDKHTDALLISSDTLEVPELEIQIQKTSLPMSFIGAKATEKILANDFSNVMQSEPFYMKKVHINHPKKRF